MFKDEKPIVVYVFDSFDEEPGCRTEYVNYGYLSSIEITKMAERYSKEWHNANVRVYVCVEQPDQYTYVPTKEFFSG